jgi:hypothetical protein
MKSLPLLALSLVAAGLPACGGDPESTVSANGPVDPPVPEQPATPPDTDALLSRVSARWDVISHDDWLQAYDYLEPTRRAKEKLPTFLGGKDDFTYRNPSAPVLLGLDGDTAYVAVDCEWTHEQITIADNLHEGAMQPLSSVEVWVWEDGQWYWRATRARSEFQKEHPELFEGK